MQLKNKVAVITGAGAGIGEATTRLFAREGAHVVAVDLSPAGINPLAEELRRAGLKCAPQVGDVSRRQDVERIINWTVQELGGLHVLFNNAGIVPMGALVDCSDEEWDRTMAINLTSMFYACRFVIPIMRRQGGGSIINTASVAGFSGVKNRGAYSVSKAGVVGLTKSLAIDFAADRIRVNCISPGTVDTPSLAGRIATAADPVKARQDFIARQPMGRIGTAEEIAGLALYLASDISAYVTGQSIVIDGGMTL